MATAQPDAPARPAQVGLRTSLRILVRLHLILLALLVSIPLHYLARGVVRHSPLPRLFLRVLVRIVGGRVRIEGTPLGRDVFFLANHLSWIDIPALAGASGTAFVAKQEVAETPLIGWLARLNRTVFVRREARLDVASQINDLREALEDNRAVAIFPEGTTTDGLSLLPFKTAMLKVLEPPPPGIMVQPVVMDYGAAAPELCWIGDEPGLANALRVLGRRGTFEIRVHFLEPFSPALAPGRKAIAAQARARIEARLTALLGEAPRPFALDVGAIGFKAAVPTEVHDRAEGE